jgi:hypothetical protein
MARCRALHHLCYVLPSLISSIRHKHPSSSAMSKLLTVFGTTGQQGGALIDHLLASPMVSSLLCLRAVTRDASKPTARSIETRGVENFEVITKL